MAEPNHAGATEGLCIDTHQVRSRGVFNIIHPHPPGREDFLIHTVCKNNCTIQLLPSALTIKYFVNILTQDFNTSSPHIKALGESIWRAPFIGVAYQGKDIVFRFIIEYSSLIDFGP